MESIAGFFIAVVADDMTSLLSSSPTCGQPWRLQASSWPVWTSGPMSGATLAR
jgi:hypothetical protein